MTTSTSTSLAQTEARLHSPALRRELSVFDLALAQILIIIVPEFFGTAVKAGSSHVVLWMLALFCFLSLTPTSLPI
jgi:hypothetical protein